MLRMLAGWALAVSAAVLIFGSSRGVTTSGALENATPIMSIDVEGLYGLSLSSNGSRLAVFDGSTNIWDVKTGRLVGTLKHMGGGNTFSMTALLDDPCVGLSSGRWGAPGPITLVLFTCKGELSAEFKNLPGSDNMFASAVAVPSCRLFVARFWEAVTVIDEKQRATRPELSKLFPKSIAAVTPAHKSCSVFAVENTGEDHSATRIVRIDLDTGVSTEFVSLACDNGGWRSTLTARGEQNFAVSPDDQFVALLIAPCIKPPQADPEPAMSVEVFDTRNKARVRSHTVSRPLSLSFLTPYELLVLEEAYLLYVLDTTSGATAPVSLPTSKTFRAPYLTVQSGSSLAIAAIPSEVRVYDLSRLR